MRIQSHRNGIFGKYYQRDNDENAARKDQSDTAVANTNKAAGFRGLAGYYRQYVENFSDRMRPLNEAINRKEFIRGGEEERAFQDIKKAYRDEQILILIDLEKQIYVHADASDYALERKSLKWKKKTSTFLFTKTNTQTRSYWQSYKQWKSSNTIYEERNI
jgi:hypothetical protein